MRAGWHDVHLFIDGSVRIPSHLAHLKTSWREQSIGASAAWMLSLAELVAGNPSADVYALFQDDAFVHFSDSLKNYLESALWPGGGESIVSLYNPGVFDTRGWHPIPRDWDWGTLAVLFPARLARQLLSDAHVWRRALPGSPGEHMPIPDLLREWLRRRGVTVWTTMPSLVQHIGRTSSIWPFVGLSGRRRAAWFSDDVNFAFQSADDFSGFNEEAFQPRPSLVDAYQRQIVTGRARMKQSKVVICTIADNTRVTLERTARRIERLGAGLSDYRVVVVESNSSDGTQEFLQEWRRQNSRVEILSGIGQANASSKLSAARLAELRNMYVDHVRAHYADFTHAIVLDADLIGGWSLDGIAHTFGYDGWDCVSSNGMEQVMTPPQHRPKRRLFDRAMTPGLSKPPRRGNPWMPVAFCYGGLVVYQLPCMLTCRYGADARGNEHIVFHERLREAGYVAQFMNPSQIALKSPLVD